MKKKKKEQIILPDYSDWLVIDDYDIIDLYASILNKIKEILGDKPLYIVWKSFDKEYKVFETDIDNIKMCRWDSGELKLEFRKGYVYNIHKIYKDKFTAYQVADQLNIDYIQANIENYKKKLDALNPIKVMEDAENQRKSLLEKYEQEKAKLDKIMQNSGEVNSNDSERKIERVD